MKTIGRIELSTAYKRGIEVERERIVSLIDELKKRYRKDIFYGKKKFSDINLFSEYKINEVGYLEAYIENLKQKIAGDKLVEEKEG